MTAKYCAYVAGDKNIIYPAIVLFLSIKRFHHSDLDFFIITESDSANEEQKQICKDNNIKVVDLSALNAEDYLNNFDSFGRWPKEIFYNYYAPIYFHEKFNYKYAIKMDYDMLCVDKLNFDEIQPSKKEIITVLLKNKISKHLSKNDIDKIQRLENCTITDVQRTANVGFIVFDLEQYVNNKVHEIYLRIYQLFINEKINIKFNETLEQLGFGFIQTVLNTTFKQLPHNYNFRPGVFNNGDSQTIVHYTTILKPWKEFDMNSARKRTNSDYGFSVLSQLLFCNKWIEFCNTLNFKFFNRKTKIYSEWELALILRNLKTELILSIENKYYFQNILKELKQQLNINENYKISPQGNYLQIYLFNSKDIHYEILLKKGVQVCLHFEGIYKKDNNILESITIPAFTNDITFANNSKKGEICFLISNINDIENIVKALSLLILCTKDFVTNNVKNVKLI